MKYVIDFWKLTGTYDRHEITVEADSREEAQEKVRRYFEDGVDTGMSEEEIMSEIMVEEGEIADSTFGGLCDA